MKRLDHWLLGAWVLLLSCAASAAQSITVGQVAPLRSPASVGNQMRAGIELCFEAVNRSGGIAGNRLKLVSKDRVDAADAAARTRELVREVRPVALIGLMGTGPMEALLKDGVLEELKVPVVGIRTGASSLHSQVNRWLFHTRAGYAAEAHRIVEHLVPIGYTKVAVIHERSAFGLEGSNLVRAALATRGLAPAAVADYERDGRGLNAAAEAIGRGEPHAVVAIGESAAVADFLKALRGTGSRAQVVALSTVDAAAVVQRVGEPIAHGLAIAQVVPSPLNSRTAVAREYRQHARELRPEGFALTQPGLEGYIAAKVLVEALRRAGATPGPAQLHRALEGLGLLDLGGMHVEFSPTRHSGTAYVDIAVIGPDGRLRH